MRRGNNDLGELRRSSVVMTFAPGSVVDFRADGAPVSAVIAGLEEWDRAFPPDGVRNPQTIFEPRLQKKLDVDGFRLPPVAEERPGREDADSRALVAVRFPAWLQCPQCDEIAPAKKWASEPGRAYRYCGRCSAGQPGGRRVAVIPVRFVMACSRGHLDEFPWHYWVSHRSGCTNARTEGRLQLKAERAGLAGLILSCPGCGARRPMEGIFGRNTFKGFRCTARRPWLPEERDPDGCGPLLGRQPPDLRALQRGASNLYFPALESALDIPPWSDQLQQALGVYWDGIVRVETPPERRIFIGVLAKGPLRDVLTRLAMTPEQLSDTVEDRLTTLERTAGEDLRWEEYRRLSSGIDTTAEDDAEFEIRNHLTPSDIAGVVGRLVRVTRLREVRALTGFTRIYPPGGDGEAAKAPVARTRMRWLPAIEVRGEGIFFTMNVERLKSWERQPEVMARSEYLRGIVEADWAERYGDLPCPVRISARLLLMHTLAHALILQLTLECGYSTASLRERLYIGPDGDEMCGVLIYTSTPDSDGTLGGLARQGLPDRFADILRAALCALQWCSSDPLCSKAEIGGPDAFSLAACHACCLVPETSCEHFNRYLDRAVLVGQPDMPSLGFARSLLPGEFDGPHVAAPDPA